MKYEVQKHLKGTVTLVYHIEAADREAAIEAVQADMGRLEPVAAETTLDGDPQDRYEAKLISPALTDVARPELPPSRVCRWIPSRKAAVLAGIAAGVITVEAACERWQLSLDELAGWQSAFDQRGLRGLRATGGIRPTWIARAARHR